MEDTRRNLAQTANTASPTPADCRRVLNTVRRPGGQRSIAARARARLPPRRRGGQHLRRAGRRREQARPSRIVSARDDSSAADPEAAVEVAERLLGPRMARCWQAAEEQSPRSRGRRKRLRSDGLERNRAAGFIRPGFDEPEGVSAAPEAARLALVWGKTPTPRDARSSPPFRQIRDRGRGHVRMQSSDSARRCLGPASGEREVAPDESFVAAIGIVRSGRAWSRKRSPALPRDVRPSAPVVRSPSQHKPRSPGRHRP